MADLVWTGRFTREVQHAFAQLEDRCEGAGLRFHGCLLRDLALLENYPRLMRAGHSGLRRLPIASTTLCVLYRVESRGIMLHALVDLRQNPETIARIIREITEGLN